MHCAQWLRDAHPRLLAFHVPNERRGGVGAGVHFQRMGVRPGVADWLLFGSQRSLAIELKDAKRKLRPEQIDFQKQWTACGHLYVVARTIEEFKAAVQALVLFG